MAEPLTLTLEQSTRAIENTKARTKREVAARIDELLERFYDSEDELTLALQRLCNDLRGAPIATVMAVDPRTSSITIASLSEDERAILAERVDLATPLADNDPGDGLPVVRERDDFEQGMMLLRGMGR